jgi:hypothetical protein
MEPAMANDGRQTPQQAARARRMRNIALGGALFLLVVVFYLMTIVRLGGHALD